MCETGKEIRLCSCMPNPGTIVHNKRSRRFKDDRRKFQWTLNKYLGPAEYQMDGMMIYPEDYFAGNLTIEIMLEQLNSRNCFDFDYFPAEGDNLEIRHPDKHYERYMSFVFINSKWATSWFHKSQVKTAEINFGKVEFDKTSEQDLE